MYHRLLSFLYHNSKLMNQLEYVFLDVFLCTYSPCPSKVVIRVNNPLDSSIEVKLSSELPSDFKREVEFKPIDSGRYEVYVSAKMIFALNSFSISPTPKVLSPAGSVIGLASMTLDAGSTRDEAARVPVPFDGNCEVSFF